MKDLHLSRRRSTAASALAFILFTPIMASAAPLLKAVPRQAPPSGAQMVAQAQPDHAPDSSAPDSSTQSSSSTNQPQAAPPSTGTAIAPYEKQDGITGSRPAGAAIAAGKQRRTHTFAIRVGLIVGAAIAVGVVAAASEGSPARAN